MDIPKSISPDRIVDAFVEVRYDSHLPFEIVVGTIFQNLDESYIYTNAPSKNLPVGGLNLSLGGTPLFYNDKIKIMLLDNSILFNILSSYIGWKEYIYQIKKVLSQIAGVNSPIKNYRRASVRYISEYPEMNIHDSFKFNFSFGLPHVKSDVYTFRSEFQEEDLKIFLNFQNNVKIKSTGDKKISTVDIDVLNENVSGNSIEYILEAISTAHDKQKEVFFSIMKEEYLKTLKPIY
ncbi:hypothetical protein BWZ20_08705 [Winogradskyella sp. J14-2]|uniref:TIGR04255 family protein n=1 Tax=Winogradskyella sp. J14-2 TaxID=1936080 RepID=UPI0009728C42|nr:TIGR04255 family protein [Winogradskyella sp. J14-2]APY08373.1 hypothetical protein BWZ20_08705 [Winogradskyella sp. J14-2]